MAERLNVLILCEESGAVRRAFQGLGHNAWSCDLVPARDGEMLYHILGDAREVLAGRIHTRFGAPIPPSSWDLIIAFPPCTYLCNSGVRWFTTIPAKPAPGVAYGTARDVAMQDAADLFAAIYKADVPRVAIENPVMHKYARETLARRGVPGFSQSVQPWQFGHGEVKRTCFWLKGLPPLVPTKVVEGREARVHRASPGKHRARDRSETYQGIAEAMAAQWGGDARGGSDGQ